MPWGDDHFDEARPAAQGRPAAQHGGAGHLGAGLPVSNGAAAHAAKLRPNVPLLLSLGRFSTMAAAYVYEICSKMGSPLSSMVFACAATTTAASAFVCVTLTENTRPFAKAAARPERRRTGAPFSARSSSTSRSEKPRTPVPIAFENASFAAKEAATLCGGKPRRGEHLIFRRAQDPPAKAL